MALTVIDAKGKRRRVYSPMAEALMPPFISSLDPETRRSIRKGACALGNYGYADGARAMWRAIVTLGFLGVVGAVAAYFLLGVFGTVVVGTLAAIPMVLDAVRLRHSFYPAWPLAVVPAMIQHRRCPSCAQPMLPPEGGDTQMTCTECGACWNEDISEWLLTSGGMKHFGEETRDDD